MRKAKAIDIGRGFFLSKHDASNWVVHLIVADATEGVLVGAIRKDGDGFFEFLSFLAGVTGTEDELESAALFVASYTQEALGRHARAHHDGDESWFIGGWNAAKAVGEL